MSASREKKQRQIFVGEGPTQAQLREQKEAAAKKRQTIIYWVIGIIAVIAVTALLVWNSGIFQRGTVAATVGDTKLTVGEMQCYYNLSRSNELYQQQLYASMGYSLYSDPYKSYDFYSSLGDNQIFNTETNQTYRQHWEETALTNARRTIAISAAAKAAGYTLSADGQKKVDDEIAALPSDATSSGYPSVSSYLSAYYGRYVTENILRSVTTARELASEYQTHCQSQVTVEQADLDKYAEEKPADVYSYDFRYAFISGTAPTTDADGNTVDPTDEQKANALASAKAKADSLVAAIQEAESDDVKEDLFTRLVAAAVGETSTYANANSNLQTGILGYDLSPNYYNSAYYEWLTSADRVKYDVTAIEGSDSAPGYHVILFLNRYLNDENTVDFRHILIQPEELVDDPDTPDVDESKGREDDPETEDIDESKIPTDEQLAAAKAKAEEILAQYEAGEKTEAAFGTLANENSSDGGSNTAGGLYTYVEQGDMVENVDAWIFDPARQPGDTGIVSNVEPGSRYYGYHVMYFVGVNDPRWRAVAESALKSETNSAWLEDVLAPYPASWVDLGSLTR